MKQKVFMLNALTHTLLVREGFSSGGGTVAARVSADYQVDGESLLQLLVKSHGGHNDFMGNFVRGFPDVNAETASRLTLQLPPNSPTGRVLLYICPECGDIGCGAYSAVLQRSGSTYKWSEFAYENGYEDARLIENVGPYSFEASEYESAVAAAHAL
jgi:hypothetical protein